MGKSIVSDKYECFVCGMQYGLERHHCFHGTANRKLADEDGLWVWLCPDHHRGTNGVHGKNGHYVDLRLKRAAELAYMDRLNRTPADFLKRYGKSYL